MFRRTIAACGLAFALSAPALAGEIVSPADALARVQAGQTTFIDVRTPDEWAQTGRAKGTKGITLQDPEFVQKVLAAVGGDKSKPVTLICRSGSRSARAMAQLEEAGFTKVGHVAEGTSGGPNGPGWIARGLPVEK